MYAYNSTRKDVIPETVIQARMDVRTKYDDHVEEKGISLGQLRKASQRRENGG